MKKAATAAFKPGDLVYVTNCYGSRFAAAFGLGVVLKQSRKNPPKYNVAWPHLKPKPRWVPAACRPVQMFDAEHLVKASNNPLTIT